MSLSHGSDLFGGLNTGISGRLRRFSTPRWREDFANGDVDGRKALDSDMNIGHDFRLVLADMGFCLNETLGQDGVGGLWSLYSIKFANKSVTICVLLVGVCIPSVS